MNLNPEQARGALNDIRSAQRRVAIFSGYQRAAPHFWLWGAIWLIGYGATDLEPEYAGKTWLALNLIGFLAGAWLARKRAGPSGRSGNSDRSPWDLPARQVLLVGLAFTTFIAATFILFKPTPMQFGAFPALLVGFSYTLVGIWGGVRWLVTGINLSLMTMIGYLYVPQYFMLWMAVIGGGTLIDCGFWMKKH